MQTCSPSPLISYISIGWLIWKFSPQNTRLGSWGYELIEVFVALHTMHISYVNIIIHLFIEYQYVRRWGSNEKCRIRLF